MLVCGDSTCPCSCRISTPKGGYRHFVGTPSSHTRRRHRMHAPRGRRLGARPSARRMRRLPSSSGTATARALSLCRWRSSRLADKAMRFLSQVGDLVSEGGGLMYDGAEAEHAEVEAAAFDQFSKTRDTIVSSLSPETQPYVATQRTHAVYRRSLTGNRIAQYATAIQEAAMN